MAKQFDIWILSLICIIQLFSLGTNLSAKINTDSLESAINTVNKSGKLNILNTLSSYYLTNSAGKAIEYGLQANSIASELKDNTRKIVALINIGDAYLRLNDNKQSLTYYEQALEIANSVSLKKEFAQVSLKIGNYYNNCSIYDKALKYDLEALKTYKTLDDKTGLSDTYHNIGIVYFYLGNLEKSLDFTQNALKIREELNDKLGISKSLNNVAMIYRNSGKNDKALEYYFKALKLMEELNSVNDQSFAMTNIGNTYKQMGDYDNALNFYLKSLAMYDHFTDDRNKSKLFVCLGMTYTDLKKYDKAESYLEQGLNLAKKTGYLDMIALNYWYLADLYLMMGNFKMTLDYKNQYIDIKDSVFSDANQKRIAEFQARIESDNTQREAELIKEKSNLLSSFIVSMSLAFVLLFVVIYSRKRNKQNANKALDKLNFINVEANFSIENIILWSNYQIGTYKFAPKNINLSEEINNSIQLSNPIIDRKNIIVTNSTSDNINVYVDPIALNLIIRYLIFDAVKGSFEGEQVIIKASPIDKFIEVSIAFSSLSNKSEEITMIFSRDFQEIFFNKENEPRENFGLALCKEFIEKSGGKIRVEKSADKQASFIFSLPNMS
jgi:tetratricopeptide (TPR) repeat protein